MKLKRLTLGQVALLSVVRDEWMAIGLSTEPADRAGAEEAVRVAYRVANLAEPQAVIWLGSPLAGCVAVTLLSETQVRDQVRDQVWGQVRDQVRDQVWDQVWGQVGDQVGGPVWDQVWGQVGDQVRAQVRGQVRAQVWDQVRAQVGAQVRAQVRAQVWDQVRAQVGDQVRDQVGDQVRDQVGDQVRDQVGDQVGAQVRAQVGGQVWGQVYRCGYGLHDAAWLGFYDVFRQFGLDLSRLDGLMALARTAGWWWPFRNAVILTERPCELRRDDQHRLHCVGGPALRYPDGWSIYAWHGICVPERVITSPASITTRQIQDEANVEVRRVMLERFGTERYVQESGAVRLHRDDWGELYRADLWDEPVVMVRVVNSTPDFDGTLRDYWLRVDPELRPLLSDGRLGAPQQLTARNAVASTFGLRGEEYHPEQQT